MKFNIGIAEIFRIHALPLSIFGPLSTIQFYIGTSTIIPSIFHWKLFGYPELIGQIPGITGCTN